MFSVCVVNKRIRFVAEHGLGEGCVCVCVFMCVAVQACAQNGMALQFASDEIRSNEEVVPENKMYWLPACELRESVCAHEAR